MFACKVSEQNCGQNTPCVSHRGLCDSKWRIWASVNVWLIKGTEMPEHKQLGQGKKGVDYRDNYMLPPNEGVAKENGSRKYC